ncbi:hypothetical protein EC55P2_00005 [Enterococcus phage EC55P2]|nr:hypothetical protein EC55P2_00005 [Enterococcus phage EC55P2]
MKVKELAEVIYPNTSLYIDGLSTIYGTSYMKLYSVEYLVEHYGERLVEEIETEHDYDASFLYITLKEED